MIVGATDLELADYMAEPDFSAFAKTADDVLADIKRGFSGVDGAEHFGCLGWPRVRHAIEFRPEEVTLWAGSNGSRKSMLAGQVMLDLAQQGYRSLTISLEMSLRRTMERMFRQAAASRAPSPRECDVVASVMRERIWVFDHVGHMGLPRLSAVLRWAKDKLGVEHVLVDSMMKVVNGDDDYNGQKDFVNAMTEIAKETGLHLHVVVHTKKPQEGVEKVPTKWDVKGTSAVTDLAHNVITIWRNRSKEAEAKEAQRLGKSGPDEKLPDQLIDIQKQRNGEFEGRISLWFDPDSFQFMQDHFDRPRPYLAPRSLEAA